MDYQVELTPHWVPVPLDDVAHLTGLTATELARYQDTAHILMTALGLQEIRLTERAET